MAVTERSPDFAETRTWSMRLPHWGWFLLAVLVLVASYLAVGGWLMSLQAQRTIDRFLRYAHDGDIASCQAMLAEDRSDNEHRILLDEHALQIAADRPLTSEPASILDYVSGRHRFRVDLAAFNDHSFTVAGGRVTLGSSFWRYTPTGPEFKLSKRFRATEDEATPEAVELDSEYDP
jgi:hypothetical protein